MLSSAIGANTRVVYGPSNSIGSRAGVGSGGVVAVAVSGGVVTSTVAVVVGSAGVGEAGGDVGSGVAVGVGVGVGAAPGTRYQAQSSPTPGTAMSANTVPLSSSVWRCAVPPSEQKTTDTMPDCGVVRVTVPRFKSGSPKNGGFQAAGSPGCGRPVSRRISDGFAPVGSESANL